MYPFFLIVHSWLRWLALVAGILAAVQAYQTPADRPASEGGRGGLVFTICMDVQMLVGLILYVFLSPFTSQAFHDFGAAMQNAGLRFWAVEHITTMVLAVACAHAGSRQAKRAWYRRAAIVYAIAVVLMAIGMPWPARAAGRALFRFS